MPRFGKHIWCFSPGEALRTALGYMREEGFSQVVVREGNELILLTVEGVARWLAEQATGDTIDLADVTVGQALACDLAGSSVVVSGDETVEEARNAFSEALQRGWPRLYAIIITQGGRHDEPPIGIITPWDLLA